MNTLDLPFKIGTSWGQYIGTLQAKDPAQKICSAQDMGAIALLFGMRLVSDRH
jgi:dihydropteroate synthase